jgi:hypothetical protein
MWSIMWQALSLRPYEKEKDDIDAEANRINKVRFDVLWSPREPKHVEHSPMRPRHLPTPQSRVTPQLPFLSEFPERPGWLQSSPLITTDCKLMYYHPADLH